MREILGTLGEVVPFPPGVRIFGSHGLLPLRREYDVAIMNWLENKIVDDQGRPSPTSLLKLLLQTVLFRAKARRLVLVRHNRYPHGTQKRYAALVSRCIDLYEHLYDSTITHSEAEATTARTYCPHPLYAPAPCSGGPLPEELDIAPGYFLIFGRIERYKRIENLLERFPANQRLLVVGAAEDNGYAAELSRWSRENIIIVPGFVSEGTAQKVLARAAAAVLSHADDDMVVSGSFFYAVSFGKPVLAIETPFLRWTRARLGEQAVCLAPHLDGLVERIRTFQVPQGSRPAPLASALAEFGDETVRSHFQRVLRLSD